MLDLVIRSAKVCDGTGNPWYRADVAVKDGRIVAIGVVKAKARRVIDARRLVLSPGFVDIHAHHEDIVAHPSADNMLRQGVTTSVSGNCGFSAWPIGKSLANVAACKPAINYATFVGHGEIRQQVMGEANRKPTVAELRKMCRLADRAMSEGAVGMSTGLFYVPGAYADVAELAAISKVVAARGGIYASHKRSAGGKLFESFAEAAEIGKRAGIGIEISHLKVLHRRGRTKADRAAKVLEAVARYREEGIEFSCDTHPYPATNTMLSAPTIPPWVSQDGRLAERLADPAIRRRIRKEVAGKIAWLGGPEKIQLARCDGDRSLDGLTVAEAATKRGRNPVDTVMDLIVAGGANCIFHALRPADIARILCDPLVCIASDSDIIVRRSGVVHPRNYGTFPRVIREYVRERKLLPLEEAVRKMTSMPARKVGLRDRGLIAVGFKADLVAFDPSRIADRATFASPHRYPVGIRAIIVNGHLAFDGRTVSETTAGEVIRNG